MGLRPSSRARLRTDRTMAPWSTGWALEAPFFAQRLPRTGGTPRCSESKGSPTFADADPRR
eukprot:15455610-Alexandrium_andersonii.AAC.1